MQKNSARLGYVAISRVKSLNNMIVNPISLESLTLIRPSRNFHLTLFEESRLKISYVKIHQK